MKNNHLMFLTLFKVSCFPFSLGPRVCCKYNKNFEKILTTQLKSGLKAFNVIRRSGLMQYIF